MSLQAAIAARPAATTALLAEDRTRRYTAYLDEARVLAEGLCDAWEHDCRLDGSLGDLQFFALDERSRDGEQAN